jgi:hypothetical protein
MKIKFKGPFTDRSGLGQAALNFYNLFRQYANKEEEKFCFECNTMIHGTNVSALNKTRFPYDGDYEINFIYSVPYKFSNFIEKDKINIGYTMWETDDLHEDFIKNIKELDLLFVPTKENKKVFKKYIDNVEVLPIPISYNNIALLDKNIKKEHNDIYKIYSIFSWSDRKGGMESIKAFDSAFELIDDVIFLIKVTNILKKELEHKIKDLKTRPKISIVSDFLDEQKINDIHFKMNAYFSMSKGEGWNLPLCDAALFGNQIISTHPSGFTEYLKNNDMFYPIKTTKKNIKNSDFKYMTENQKWQEPSIKDASEKLLIAYDDYLEGNNTSDIKKQCLDVINYDNVLDIFFSTLRQYNL